MTIFVARLAETRRNLWAVVPDRKDFLDRMRRNTRKTNFLGFVAKSELRDDALQGAKLLTAQTLVPFLATFARRRSSTAMCSM